MLNLKHLLRFRIQNIPFIVGFLLLLVLVRRSQENWQTLAEFVEDRKYYDLIAVHSGVRFIDKPPVTQKDQVGKAVEQIVARAHRNTVFILGESRDAPEIVVQPAQKFREDEIKKAEEVWADGPNYYKIYSRQGFTFPYNGETYHAIATNLRVNGIDFDMLALTCVSKSIEAAYYKSTVELTVLLGTVTLLVLIVLTSTSKAVVSHSRTILSREKSIIKRWWPEEIKMAAANHNQFLTSEALYKIQIDQSTSGQMIVRSRGLEAALIYSPNKAVEAISGYTQAELEGRPLNLIVPDAYHSFHVGLGVYDKERRRRVGMAAYAEGCPYFHGQESTIVGRDRTVDLKHKDGSIRKVILGVYYFGRNDDGVDEWAGAMTDVTELVSAVATAEEAQKALEITNKELVEANKAIASDYKKSKVMQEALLATTDSLEAKTIELEKAKVVAENLAKSERAIREEFEKLQQSWRHDLLSAVLGAHNMFEVLNNIGFKVEDPKFKEPYEIARAKASFAYKLVKETRDLNVAMEDMEKKPATLRSLMDSIKILYPEANITYSLTDEDRQILMSESNLVGRAISNIINNAIKFSGLNGIIEVGIRAKDEFAIIYVKDNGIGMDEEGQKKIFGGFGTGVRLRQDIRGDGFGLHSALNIVKGHDGTLTVKSKLGQGSVFFIKLPLLP